MKKINLQKFPLRKQDPDDNCIPATIANIMEYHGKKIDQSEIRKIYKNYTDEPISFERIKKALDKKFSDEFNYEIKNKENDYENYNEYLKFIYKNIDSDLPIITVFHIPTNKGHRVHMLTILGIDENDLLIYDTDENISKEPIRIKKTKLETIIHPNLTSFLITPK